MTIPEMIRIIRQTKKVIANSCFDGVPDSQRQALMNLQREYDKLDTLEVR